ncbi:mechanosensitive ion channel [bacterium]|nr:mechanosensitive ion channel [bacterium]
MKKIIILSVLFASIAFCSGSYVHVGQIDLFSIEQAGGGFSSIKRANLATRAIEMVMENPNSSTDSILIANNGSLVTVNFKRTRLFTVHPADTTGTGLTQMELAERWRKATIEGIETERKRSISAGNLAKFALGVLFPFLVIVIYILVQKLYSSLCKSAIKKEGTFFKGISFRNVEVIPAKLQVNIVLKLLVFFKWALLTLIFYVMILVFFNLFPATKIYTEAILETSLHWLRNIGNLMADVLKFIVFSLVFYLIARVLWGLSDMTFRHYATSPTTIKIPQAALEPLRRLTKIIIVFIFLLLLLAAIPGPGNYFALVLFVALLIVTSIAAMPFITSAIAGLSILLTRQIKTEDRVEVDGIIGQVKSIGLLWTTIEIDENKTAILMNHSLLAEKTIRFRNDKVELSDNKTPGDSDK